MSSQALMTDLYDPALLGILQHVGDIQNFLQVYFGFLYRKTDFYRLLTSPADKMGFPPGIAEKMVLKTFKAFERVALQDHERSVREAEERLRKQQQEEERRAAPPAVGEEEVVVEVESTAEESELEQEKPVQAEPQSHSQSEQPPNPAASASSDHDTSGTQGGAVSSQPLKPDAANPEQDQELFQANPDSYNGAVRENYTWSQDYTDLEIRVPVPKDVVKGRQVLVDIQSVSLRVAVLEGGSERVLMDGRLTHRINTENSLWSLVPAECVLLSLSKVGECWWQAVLEGEQTIDVNKINRERSVATVDEEEHAVLDRLTFDYQRKLQGKPQSHELKVHEMLQKGWDAEGSPFKGQQFDPAMFDIPPGAVQF
ncbi:nudC domain-containing protein 3-like [Acipenser ruthenus]|uniref:nudC domain-containing protein 3-like n=1 Tax=Acipenser ruthenus TaxID=7906 RepID=UPI002741A686|nr:nudC domain-containing protein 3-like [Acipenser ruthenus]